MKEQIIQFLQRAEWEGSYEDVISQFPHLIPNDPKLQAAAKQWLLWMEVFNQRLQQLGDEYDIEIDYVDWEEDD